MCGLYLVISHYVTFYDNCVREVGSDGNLRFSQCSMYAEYPDPYIRKRITLNKTIVPCTDGWEYDQRDYSHTIPTQFNWVCSKSHYATQALTALSAGGVAGTIILGRAGDK